MTSVFALRELAQTVVERSARVDGRTALGKATRRCERDLAAAFKRQGADFLRRFDQYRSLFREADAPKPPAGFEDSWAKTEAATASTFEAIIERVGKLAITIGGQQAASVIGGGLSFSLKNPRAVEYLAGYGAELVKGINQATRDAIRKILVDGIGNGDSYQKVAKAIRDQFDEFSVKRARMIAITEAGNGYAEGNLIMARTAQAQGIAMEKAWQTAGDERVDPESCLPNEEAGWIPLEDAFPSGDQRPLAHPLCRCDLLYRRVRKAA